MALNVSKEYTLEHIANKSFDKTTQMNAVQGLAFDGTDNLQRQIADNTQIYAVAIGGYNYFCFSAVGTPLATAKWMVFRVDDSGNKIYADGSADFKQIATDPTLLNFVYNV